MSEAFDSYVSRKEQDGVHGNNPEMQAASELFNRAIEVYVPEKGSERNCLTDLHSYLVTNNLVVPYARYFSGGGGGRELLLLIPGSSVGSFYGLVWCTVPGRIGGWCLFLSFIGPRLSPLFSDDSILRCITRVII